MEEIFSLEKKQVYCVKENVTLQKAQTSVDSYRKKLLK